MTETLMTLPEEQRPGGLAAMAHMQLDSDAPGRLGGIYAALGRGSMGEAFAAANGQEGLRLLPQPVTHQPLVEVQHAASDDAPYDTSEQREPDTHSKSTGWARQGLPGTDAAMGWAGSAYEPTHQAAILGTLDRILAAETSPETLAAVEAEIAERFAGDATAIAKLTAQARTLAGIENDDPFTGDERRTWARDAVVEARERVAAGEPYEEQWSVARPALAALESGSGLRLRPADGAGLVGVYEPGQQKPLFVLPLSAAKLLAREPGALAEFAVLAGKLARGEDISAELAAYERRLVTWQDNSPYSELPLREGESAPLEDRRAYDDLLKAIGGAQAHLAAGTDPNEVFLNLAQVVLAEQLDDSDLAAMALQTALELLPYYDLVDLGINSVALFKALEAGDSDAALEAGLGTALALIGTVPIFGDLAKSGFGWLARKLGAIPSATKRALNRLTSAPQVYGPPSAYDLSSKYAHELRVFVEKRFGVGGRHQQHRLSARALGPARRYGRGRKANRICSQHERDREECRDAD